MCWHSIILPFRAPNRHRTFVCSATAAWRCGTLCADLINLWELAWFRFQLLDAIDFWVSICFHRFQLPIFFVCFNTHRTVVMLMNSIGHCYISITVRLSVIQFKAVYLVYLHKKFKQQNAQKIISNGSNGSSGTTYVSGWSQMCYELQKPNYSLHIFTTSGKWLCCSRVVNINTLFDVVRAASTLRWVRVLLFRWFVRTRIECTLSFCFHSLGAFGCCSVSIPSSVRNKDEIYKKHR